MDSALNNLNKSKSSAAPSASPQPVGQAGYSKQTINSPLADANGQPSVTEKDYLRAQIEKFWSCDPGARDNGRMNISVKIQVQPDGTVMSAEFANLDTGRYASDPAYRAAADRARRAPKAASPLKLPPGKPDFYRTYPEITLRYAPEKCQ